MIKPIFLLFNQDPNQDVDLSITHMVYLRILWHIVYSSDMSSYHLKFYLNFWYIVHSFDMSTFIQHQIYESEILKFLYRIKKIIL